MKKYTLLITILMSGLLALLNSSIYAKNSPGTWEMKKNNDGIAIFVRETTGSNLLEFKGIVTLNYSIEKVQAVLENVPGHVKWMANVNESKVISDDPANPIQYNLIKAPGPVSDRDVVLLGNIARTKNRVSYSFRSITHNSYPPRKGVVRIPSLKGSWVLEKLDDNRTRVTYQSLADPGGSLPAWLVNKTVVDQPFVTLRGMRNQLEKQ